MLKISYLARSAFRLKIMVCMLKCQPIVLEIVVIWLATFELSTNGLTLRWSYLIFRGWQNSPNSRFIDNLADPTKFCLRLGSMPHQLFY